jgi:hypothetical protein
VRCVKLTVELRGEGYERGLRGRHTRELPLDSRSESRGTNAIQTTGSPLHPTPSKAAPMNAIHVFARWSPPALLHREVKGSHRDSETS